MRSERDGSNDKPTIWPLSGLTTLYSAQPLGREHRSVVRDVSWDAVQHRIKAMHRDLEWRVRRAQARPVPGHKLYYVETQMTTVTVNQESGTIDIWRVGDPVWLTDQEAEILKCGGTIEFDRRRIQCGGVFAVQADEQTR